MTGCRLAGSGRIYRNGKDTGYRVLNGCRVVGSDEGDTGYRLALCRFYDVAGMDTGFYVGGCGAAEGCGPIYGPDERMPWEE